MSKTVIDHVRVDHAHPAASAGWDGRIDPYPEGEGAEEHREAITRALTGRAGSPAHASRPEHPRQAEPLERGEHPRPEHLRPEHPHQVEPFGRADHLRPERLRREIAELDAVIDEFVAWTVYRVASATTAEEYTIARKRLTATFHELDGRLSRDRFLLGAAITEPDVRLWTLLVRYDTGYNPFAKISKLRLIDFPRLWAYARDLYQHAPFRDTTDFAAIARLPEYPAPPFFHDAPWRVLVEPYEADWESPHGRELLG
ncbi:glutathione S-transferase C-terminal domain-containing protein [Thermopolyspora sp. NPDC052614]|uniref:glutathione S-transferase C-terminal domain-containing protein n=1 Tax=Thermopolyspora sp. NPDC052614 TaxID=3155682 RepID=UPI003432F623